MSYDLLTTLQISLPCLKEGMHEFDRILNNFKTPEIIILNNNKIQQTLSATQNKIKYDIAADSIW